MGTQNASFKPCVLCAGTDFKPFHKIKRAIHPQNIYCNSCGMVFVNPIISEKDYNKYYTKKYAAEVYKTGKGNEKQIIAWRTKSSKKKIEYFKKIYKKGLEVFEIGSGTGTFLNELKTKFGCKTSGVEPSDELRNLSKKKFALDVFPGTFDKYVKKNSQNKKFDIIVMDQVLEHLFNPRLKLKLVKGLLKEEGLIYIGVPNIYLPAHPIDEFFIPEHISSFYPWTIMLMLLSCGLKIVKFVMPETSPMHLLATHIENKKINMLPIETFGGKIDKKELIDRFKHFSSSRKFSSSLRQK